MHEYIIQDQSEEEGSIKLKATDGTCGFLIAAEGYGEKCSDVNYSHPVLIELYEGELRVVIWNDINKEDPTHIISLEGAKDDKRIEEDCPSWVEKHSVNCYFCNAVVDERECMDADKYNGNDGGDICPDCQKTITLKG